MGWIPSARAAASTGVGVHTCFRPTLRGSALTTPTRLTSGFAETARSDGTAKAPLPRKTVRTRPSSGGSGRTAIESGQGPEALLRVLVLVIELAHRDELVHRVEVVDVQLAVEVVELVLERAAEEPGACDLDLLADPVLGHDPDLLLPGHVRDVPGDREAALEVTVVAGGPDDLRVDELVQVVLDLDDARAEWLPQLGGGEPDAG